MRCSRPRARACVACATHPRRPRHGPDRARPSRRGGIAIDESELPVRPEVTGACEILGIDPLYVANEGKLIAVVAPEAADAALEALRTHPSAPRRRSWPRSPPNPLASSCWRPPSAAPGSSTCSPHTAPDLLMLLSAG